MTSDNSELHPFKNTMDPEYMLFICSLKTWKAGDAYLYLCGVHSDLGIIDRIIHIVSVRELTEGDVKMLGPATEEDILTLRFTEIFFNHFDHDEEYPPLDYIKWLRDNPWCIKHLDLSIWDEYFPVEEPDVSEETDSAMGDSAVDSEKPDNRKWKPKKPKRWNTEQKKAALRVRKEYKGIGWGKSWEDSESEIKNVGINSLSEFKRCYDAARKSEGRKSK